MRTITISGKRGKRSVLVERLEARPIAWNTLHLDAPRRARFAHGVRRDGDDAALDPGERSRLTQLRMLERAGLISDLEVQPSWDVRINDRPFCTYTAHFSYHCCDRKRGIIEEVTSKGVAKPESDQLKRKAAELTFGLHITEVIL